MKTKVLILDDAYFNDVYLKAGKIVEIDVDEIPSWAQKVENKQAKQEPETNNVQKDEQNNKTKDDKKQEEYLEELLNKAFEKGIFIEDTDKKSTEEQIKELEEVLKKGE